MNAKRLLPLFLILFIAAPAVPKERSFSEARAAMQRGLRSSDPHLRANAVYELDGFDSPEAVRAIARSVLIRDDRVRVMHAAIQLLGAVKAEDSVKALAKESESGHWRKRARVLESMSRVDSDVALAAQLKAAYDEDARVRTSALLSLEHKKNGRTALALEDALRAPEWPTRSAAIEMLKLQSVETAVPKLIDRLGPGGEQGRLRGDVADALARITGTDHGPSFEGWDLWRRRKAGEKVERRAVPPPPVPTCELAGVWSLAKRVVFVLAVHQSMGDELNIPPDPNAPTDVIREGGPKLALWKNAKTKLKRSQVWIAWSIERLKDDVRFNVITYAVSANSVFPDLVPATRENKRKAIKRLASLSGSGAADLYTGLRKVYTLLSRDPVDEKSRIAGPEVVYFLSDGTAGWGRIPKAYRAFEEVERLNRFRQIRWHCFGPGEFDPRVLADLAGMSPQGAFSELP